MAQLKDSYYWPNYMCTYLWSLLRLRVVTMSTCLNYIGLGTGEEWWCSDNQVTVSEKWMTAGLAPAVDTHFNKVSKNMKRRSQKRKHHSLNSYILGVTMCPMHWGHRIEQNKNPSPVLLILVGETVLYVDLWWNIGVLVCSGCNNRML